LAGLFKNLRRGGGFYNLRFQQMSLKKQESPIRNEIRDCDIRYWCRHWGIDASRISAAISKVGRSASAVRKELTVSGSIDGETGS
jgi:hypothetical protein